MSENIVFCWLASAPDDGSRASTCLATLLSATVSNTATYFVTRPGGAISRRIDHLSSSLSMHHAAVSATSRLTLSKYRAPSAFASAR